MLLSILYTNALDDIISNVLVSSSAILIALRITPFCDIIRNTLFSGNVIVRVPKFILNVGIAASVK